MHQSKFYITLVLYSVQVQYIGNSRSQGRTVSQMVGGGAPLAVPGLSNLGKLVIFRFLKFISKNRREHFSSLILKHLKNN